MDSMRIIRVFNDSGCQYQFGSLIELTREPDPSSGRRVPPCRASLELVPLMAETIVRTLEPLGWRDVTAIANGAVLKLSDDVWGRIAYARAIVEGLIQRGIRGYGINTGVGALSDVIINEEHQKTLSRNIIMSHACAVGEPFGIAETRAIMVAQINNFAHGASGIRPEVVDLLLHMLEFDCIPL
ncbi:MAG: aromatic amino acid lyase, partial [Burkholderia sp.]|nr:aromatic amino acid lyase [Burkholderia sp.]